MKTGIYMIRNKVNDKKYIGQAVDIELRWKTHIWELNNNRHINKYLQRSWNKYGEDNFEFTIIHECEEELLDELEIMYIAHYHTFYKDDGYNLTLGGDGIRGYNHTDEYRAKMSEYMKEENKRRWSDPEYKAKLIKSRNRPEVKKKKSESLKEYYKDPKNRKKTSEATKEAMNRPEVRAKVSEANSKAVYCVTNDTIYASTVEAGEKLGIAQGYISWCCNGKNITKKYPNGHHIRGLEFWFLSEYEEKFGKVAI